MPPKKTLSVQDRKALLAQAKGALANRTDPGVVHTESLGSGPGAMPGATEQAGVDGDAPAGPAADLPATDATNNGEPQPAPIPEHELFQTSRLPEPALNRLAKALIDNDASDEAFKRVIVEKLQEWEQTAPGDTAARETIYHQVRALREWRAKLTQMAKASEKAEFKEIRMRAMR